MVTAALHSDSHSSRSKAAAAAACQEDVAAAARRVCSMLAVEGLRYAQQAAGVATPCTAQSGIAAALCDPWRALQLQVRWSL